MLFRAQRRMLNTARDEARAILEKSDEKPRAFRSGNLPTFFAEARYSARLIFEEPEIFVFALFQWLVIATAYVMWTQALDWIPDSVWNAISESRRSTDIPEFYLVNLFLLGWSFFVVLVASYPISLLNAAMASAHYLRNSGQSSTAAKCLTLASRNMGRLWAFTTIDAWITVDTILSRLPKRGGSGHTATRELVYYAWKIGTVGVLPSLVAGRGYLDAAKDSVALLRRAPARAIGIRMGYSALCWIVGILAYVVAFLMVMVSDFPHGPNWLYNAYILVAAPIIVATGLIAVLIRPFFLIMITKLYTDLHVIDDTSVEAAARRGPNVPALLFFPLMILLLVAFFFGDAIGLRDWVERLAARDFEAYRRELLGG